MFITSSKLHQLPIASLDDNKKIGQVSLVIFDPDDFSIAAIEVAIGSFIFKKMLYLSSKDVVDVDKNGLVVKNSEVLVEKNEIVRINKIIKDRTPIINQKAYTKNNKYLGKIFDLLIDTNSLTIDKFYISSFWHERILPRNRVIKVTKYAVIFSDDVIEQTSAVKAEGAAA